MVWLGTGYLYVVCSFPSEVSRHPLLSSCFQNNFLKFKAILIVNPFYVAWFSHQWKLVKSPLSAVFEIHCSGSLWNALLWTREWWWAFRGPLNLATHILDFWEVLMTPFCGMRKGELLCMRRSHPRVDVRCLLSQSPAHAVEPIACGCRWEWRADSQLSPRCHQLGALSNRPVNIELTWHSILLTLPFYGPDWCVAYHFGALLCPL